MIFNNIYANTSIYIKKIKKGIHGKFTLLQPSAVRINKRQKPL